MATPDIVQTQIIYEFVDPKDGAIFRDALYLPLSAEDYATLIKGLALDDVEKTKSERVDKWEATRKAPPLPPPPVKDVDLVVTDEVLKKAFQDYLNNALMVSDKTAAQGKQRVKDTLLALSTVAGQVGVSIVSVSQVPASVDKG